MNTDIYSYIETQENAYKTQKVRLGDNWEWNMRDHIQLIYHLKNSQFYKGENDWLRPFKNIMEPIIELANWTEDIEVKDIVFFIEGQEDRVLSFLIKKYHDEVFVREHNVDDFIDKITESDNEYGGVLVKDVKKGAPETPSLVNIAFCDQSDVLGGAIGFKYFFSPEGLRKMKKRGWGEKANGATISIEDLILQAESGKEIVDEHQKTDTPSKVIEVFVVHGALPEYYLDEKGEVENSVNQIQIVAFYKDKKGKKKGVTLYKKKEKEGNLMFFTASPVENRGLGRSVGEKMLHSQIWTNWLSIHRHNFYEAASKVPLYTDDEAFTNRNKVQDMENLEVMTVSQGSVLNAVQTASPANVALFSNAVNEWFEHAQLSGAAQDPLLGVEQVSGTTFKGQERSVAQGRGSHDRKRGKRAKFTEQVYRKMIIPQIKLEITNGKKFLASLSTEDISWIREQLAINYANGKIKERVMDFSKEVPTEEEKELLKEQFKKSFAQKSNKSLLEILKGEFDDVEINIGINVANKQKDLANLSDKLLSVFQYIFQNPQGFQAAMQIPALAKSFQDILEFSGLNQADFMSLIQAPQIAAPQEQPQQPQQPISLNQPVQA